MPPPAEADSSPPQIVEESDADLQAEVQEQWPSASTCQAEITEESLNAETVLLHDDGVGVSIIEDQVVEFHPDDSHNYLEAQTEDGHVIVQIQSPDPENPQGMRVIHFPISALTASGTVTASQLEQIQRHQDHEQDIEADLSNLEEVDEEEPPLDLSPAEVDSALKEEAHSHDDDNRQEAEEHVSDNREAEEDDNDNRDVEEDDNCRGKVKPELLDAIAVNSQEKQHVDNFETQGPEDLDLPLSHEASPEIPCVIQPLEGKQEPFPDDRCANCMKLFDPGEEKVSRVRKNVPHVDQNNTEPEATSVLEADVSNLEALHLIFQLPKEVQRDGEECFLCDKCAKILLVLYSAFKEFTELTQEEAYVLKKLKEISASEESSRGRRGKKKRQTDPKKMGTNEDLITQIKAEVEWEEEEEEEDELITGDFSDDEDFQASPSELAAAGVESSSSSSDDDMYVPVKKKRLMKQSRPRKSVGVGEIHDLFWDNSVKQEQLSDDEFGNRRRKSSKRSRNRKSILSGLTYDCNLCDESFLKPRALKSHLQEFHKKTHRAFDSIQEKSEDGEVSNLPDMAEEILEPPKIEDPVIPTCRLCSKEFETRIELKDHFVEDHEGELPFKCDKCERQFGETSALKRHEVSHTAEKAYKCRVCLSAFRRADELRAHWAEEHVVDNDNVVEEEDQVENISKRKRDSPEKKLKKIREKAEKSVVPCEVCGKNFARHDHLKLHLRIHTGEKPYKCNECGKAFSDPRGLAYHEVTHSNERPYCCTVCGMTFKRLHHLNDHERNHRDDIERPFACEICGKCFKYKKHLNSHMVIHGNSKDHQCEICGKAFNRKDNLRQHVKKVHGKEPGPSTMSFVETTASQLLSTTTASAIVTQALPLDASLDQIVYMHL